MPDKIIPFETGRTQTPAAKSSCTHSDVDYREATGDGHADESAEERPARFRMAITQEILEENLRLRRAAKRAAEKLRDSTDYICAAIKSGASVGPGPLAATVVGAGSGYRLHFLRDGVECTCYRRPCRCGT